MPSKCQKSEPNERGQASIALAGVLALAIVITGGFAIIAQAMVHRARARNAADAMALATVVDAQASEGLADWYRAQGVKIEPQDGAIITRSGPSQAAAWASRDTDFSTAPVLRAIVARAEQLVGREFVRVHWHERSFQLRIADADLLRPLAAEFGLCHVVDAAPTSGRETFEMC